MTIEYQILDFIRENFSCEAMDNLMKAVTFLGDKGWFWIALGVVLSIVPKTRKIGLCVCLALAFSGLICNVALKPIVARIRPYDLKEGIELIIKSPADFSFPSGHSSASFAAATAIFANNKKFGIPALILAFMIAFSRLYLYVHFPGDVVAGILLGVVCAVMAYYVIRFFEIKAKKHLTDS